MLRWVDGELGHRTRARRTHLVFAEAGGGNRDGFVETLRVYVDAMENASGIDERDPLQVPLVENQGFCGLRHPFSVRVLVHGVELRF